MNLRNVESYDIGLDIGTASVGWAVTDPAGNLLHFKKKPTWGSRLFPAAQQASAARIPRGQRRRYIRRRWRLDLLQGLFAEEVAKIDPDFFVRLNQSRLLKEDRAAGHRDYDHPLFNGADFNERDYYDRFPTIYHLRSWLMETEEKADIRLVYLALHNIVKHRGNFLRQGQDISAENANTEGAVQGLCEAIADWCAGMGMDCSLDAACESGCLCDAAKAICAVFEDSEGNRSSKAAKVSAAVALGPDHKAAAKAIGNAVVGLAADMQALFACDVDKPKFKLSDDEAVEAFEAACPDEGRELFSAIKAAYAAYVLQGLLSLRPGKTISVNKVAEYERYGEDLAVLKQLVREYAPQRYDEFFRGAFYAGTRDYDASKAKGYTRYNLGVSKLSYEEFGKQVKGVLGSTGAAEDGRYKDVLARIEAGSFLRRLKTSDNGSIYYQLHLEEMQAIIDNQSRHYPFLAEQKSKLESLVTFRIPYYVGPLQTDGAAVDARTGRMRFAWSVRKEGMEGVAIKPWNWEEVIDRHKSAEAFISRMTGTCTYLQGEPVLPKCSLLYEEFCVLNELNGARWSCDGDAELRFDAADREGIVRDLFRNRKVSYRHVEDWMARKHGHANVHVRGGQGETGFESKMGSYIFFCKDVFHVSELPEAYIPMVEKIILWNTLFEDRDILRERIVREYGDVLDEGQIKTICRKRFTGWGRLSEKLLTGVSVRTDCGAQTVMDVLRDGDPTNGHRAKAMVLMEVLRDEVLGFEAAIDKENRKHAEACGGLHVDDLPGSPALRRGVKQALGIVDEVAAIAGKPPAHVFIEVARDEDERRKGKRTTRRYNRLEEALSSLKQEEPGLWADFREAKGKDLDERLTLYFMQRGKCLYSGKPLDIDRLSESGLYEVDHIVPRAFVKDDSLENKALVLRAENQRKTDALLLEASVRNRQKDYWAGLLSAGLIGEKKYRNLMRDRVSDRMLGGFIARQLVETSQIMKFTRQMLEERYADTEVIPVKASISSQVRDRCGFAKCREANDYHHAHDAFLACRMGQFILLRHPDVYANPIGMASVMKRFVRQQSENLRRGKMPGSSTFIVESFLRSGFDKETGEIFKDAWDAEMAVAGIRRCLNYKDCFISRMPEETSGVFWDATIYSPNDAKKKPVLPLKQGLDPQKYGGYSREQFAYFFVYVARNPKKATLSLEFAPVPVRVALRLSQDDRALVEYALRLAQERGLEFVRIAKKKVLKYQLIELDGDRLFITGAGEVRNATQIAFSQQEMRVLKGLADGTDSGESDLVGLFDRIEAMLSLRSKRLARQLDIASKRDAFMGSSRGEQTNAILQLIAIINAATNMINLVAMGGGKYAGCMKPTFSKELKSQDFFFIDQSVTGMFERRYRLGL